MTNINNMQSAINTLNADVVKKAEFNERQTTLWESARKIEPMREKQTIIEDQLKERGAVIDNLRERMNAIEQLAKERAIWNEKLEARIGVLEKALESTNKDIISITEKATAAEKLIVQMQEEKRQLAKDLQALRERCAALEGRKKPSESDN